MVAFNSRTVNGLPGKPLSPKLPYLVAQIRSAFEFKIVRRLEHIALEFRQDVRDGDPVTRPAPRARGR